MTIKELDIKSINAVLLDLYKKLEELEKRIKKLETK